MFSQDFKDQMQQSGVYAGVDTEERSKALLRAAIYDAVTGSVGGLNSCWAAVKAGQMPKEDYMKVKAIYKGEASEAILSTGRIAVPRTRSSAGNRSAYEFE